MAEPPVPPPIPGLHVNPVDHSKVKLPDFTEEHTDLWFWQVEAAFEAAGITSDKRKYMTIIGQLPTNVMYKLADLRDHQPANGTMYNTLKQRIITEFADSMQTKITKLLGDISLGDRKPSQLLAEMRTKAANTPITDDLLKQLWLRNLPEQIRAIISADDEMALNTAANMADRVLEATKGPTHYANAAQAGNKQANVNPVTDTNILENIQKQMDELARQMRNLQSRSRSQSRGQTPNRSRSSKESESKFDTCWWHHKFGKDARKCKQPCSFVSKNDESNNQ